MTPLILALALMQPQGVPVTPWNPVACKPGLDPRFVHEVEPAGDPNSPIRRLSLKDAERAGGGKADAAPPKSCLIRAPLPSSRRALDDAPLRQGR